MTLLYYFLVLSQLIITSSSKSFHISMHQQNEGFLYTLTYEAPSAATVLWGYELSAVKGEMITRNDSYSGGIGRSAVLSQTQLEGIGLRIKFAYERATRMFFVFDLEGDLDLPEIELTSSLGKDFYYTPGDPLNITVRYSKRDDVTPTFSWSFLGRRNTEKDVKIFSSMASALEFVKDVNTTSRRDFYETSALVSPNNMEGLVIIDTSYIADDLWIIRREEFSLIQEGHSGPFPPDFMSFLPEGFHGEKTITCSIASVCIIHCGAAGSGITNAELRKNGHREALVPRLVERSEWLYIAVYLQYFSKEDAGNYTCSITDNKRRTMRNIMTIDVAD